MTIRWFWSQSSIRSCTYHMMLRVLPGIQTLWWSLCSVQWTLAWKESQHTKKGSSKCSLACSMCGLLNFNVLQCCEAKCVSLQEANVPCSAYDTRIPSEVSWPVMWILSHYQLSIESVCLIVVLCFLLWIRCLRACFHTFSQFYTIQQLIWSCRELHKVSFALLLSALCTFLRACM